MAARIELKGWQQVRRNLEQLGSRALPAMGRALYTDAEDIMGTSATLCPVDTGFMRNSRYASPPEIHKHTVTVTMGYTAIYSLIQHERLDFYHPVGEAKFLEKPLLAAASGMSQRLAARLKAERLAG